MLYYHITINFSKYEIKNIFHSKCIIGWIWMVIFGQISNNSEHITKYWEKINNKISIFIPFIKWEEKNNFGQIFVKTMDNEFVIWTSWTIIKMRSFFSLKQLLLRRCISICMKLCEKIFLDLVFAPENIIYQQDISC